MATRGNDNSESVKITDGGGNAAGSDVTTTLQEGSPYQAASGLNDVRLLTAMANDTSKPMLTEVQWSDVSKEQQDVQRRVAGDSLSEMITGTRTGQGQGLDALQKSNPKLAAEVGRVAELLSKQTPEQMADTLKGMREMYKGFDGLASYNKESIDYLREQKLKPDVIMPLFEKSVEINRLPANKRPAEYQKMRSVIRNAYLDGGLG